MLLNVLLLLVAIGCEVTATALLKASDGMTRLWPTVGMLVGYVAALLLLSYVLTKLPVGPVYAVWSGLGTIGAAAIGLFVFQDKFPAPAWIGVGLVVSGVVVLGYFAPPSD